jgi:hypothetical protein
MIDLMRKVSVVSVVSVVFSAGLGVLGCARNANQQTGAAPSGAFEQQWSSLAQKEVEVFYIEDDRGEGLMGNVRRARQNVTAAPPASERSGAPQELSSDEIQRVIRQNLPGVRACFLRMSHSGEQRSGKAIVSFQVGPAGDVQDTKVDAPAFQGTSLPGCVSGIVSHWAFPKSQKGALAISYPFVFVGG